MEYAAAANATLLHTPGKVSHVSYAEGLFPRLWGHLANGDIFPHSELFGSPSVPPVPPSTGH